MSKFTETQTKAIVDTYVANKGLSYEVRTLAVNYLAEEYEASVPVIRGVLVAAGVYIKKEAAAKSANGGNKEDVVLAFEAAFGLEMKSMRNMSKKDLDAFWLKFVEMSELRNVSEGK